MTWKTAPLKRFCDGSAEYGLNTPASEYRKEGFRFLRTSDINEDGSLGVSTVPVFLEIENLEGRHTLSEGDLLFSRAGTLGRCLRYRESYGPSTFAGYLIRFRPNQETDPSYVHYCSQTKFFQGAIVADAVTSTISNFNAERYSELRLPWWPLAEQRAIADFLDVETARIDALITKKRRLIELLEERRSVAIEERIRRLVLDDGEIPLKYAVEEVTVGIVITPAKWYAETGIPAMRGVNVTPGQIDMTDCVYLTEQGQEVNRKSIVNLGDVVVVRTGQAGAAAVVPEHLDGANCIDLLLVRLSKSLVPRYLEYVLNSEWTSEHIAQHSVGSIQSHFNVASLRELPITVPSVDAQQILVVVLDRICTRVDGAVDNLTRQISLLSEKRQALITSAVTGELKVS